VAPSTELKPVLATFAKVAAGSFCMASLTVYNCRPINEWSKFMVPGFISNAAEARDVVLIKDLLVVIINNYR